MTTDESMLELPRDRGLSLTDQVFQALKTEILRSQIRPGSVVIEGELAERFGVSKTPIREALRLLVQDGWIEVMPRRGYLVRPIGLDDLREVYELRRILESGVVRKVIEKMNPENVAGLLALIDAQAASGDSLEASIEASRDFHLSLARLTGNERLERSLAALLDEVERLLRMLPELVTLMTSSSEIDAHRKLVSALEDHDADRAESLMMAHLTEMSRSLLEALGGIA